MAGIVCLCLIAAEVTLRLIDGYRIDHLTLLLVEPRDMAPAQASLYYAKQRILDPTFDISWYTTDPPDYDRSPKRDLPADWSRAVANYKPSPGEPAIFHDQLRFLYNYNALKEACRTGGQSEAFRYYKKFPGFVYAFPSPDSSADPPFRAVPRGWDWGLNYYNNFGFRGPDIPPRKSGRIIRLAFIGASAVANGWPFTHPEYVAHFLRLWAKANKFDVDFDVINAGRGGFNSIAIAKIMRYEVAPLHPDIVVYYEGGNDLQTSPIVQMLDTSAGPQRQPPVSLKHLPLDQYSTVLNRIYELLFRRSGPAAEPPKPPHGLTFDLRQKDPDIGRTDLPFRLNGQIADIRDMAAAARGVGAEFFLTSFVTFVRDGVLLDRERRSGIFQDLNDLYWPLTYREFRAAVDFQNAVFRKLAQTDHYRFLDVDHFFPQDPDFFADRVHFNSQGGFRLQGWIVAQLLAPYIRGAVNSVSLPKPAYDPDPKAIAWVTEPPIKFDLSCLP
jgi:hypothetical protein